MVRSRFSPLALFQLLVTGLVGTTSFVSEQVWPRIFGTWDKQHVRWQNPVRICIGMPDGIAGQVLHQHVVDGGQLIIPNGQDGAGGEEVGVPGGVGELGAREDAQLGGGRHAGGQGDWACKCPSISRKVRIFAFGPPEKTVGVSRWARGEIVDVCITEIVN